MRLVITKSFCLPPDIVKWLEKIADVKRRSTSSVLTELLLELKKKNTKKD